MVPAIRRLSRRLTDGLRPLLRRPGATILGFGSLLAFVAAGIFTPKVGFLFVLLPLAPSLGGFPHLALDLVDRPQGAPALGAPFRGFRQLDRWIGLVWVGYLVALGAAFPLLVGLWLQRHVLPQSAAPVTVAVTGGLVALLEVLVLGRYLWAPWMAADAPAAVPLGDILEAARTRAVRHRRASLEAGLLALGLLLVGGTFHAAGLLLAIPWAASVLAVEHRRLSTAEATSGPGQSAPSPRPPLTASGGGA